MEGQQRPPRRAASGRDHRNFTGIFAVYVATCVIPNAHVDVSEISMDQSSVIFYENSEGEWEELETLHGGKNSIWADY